MSKNLNIFKKTGLIAFVVFVSMFFIYAVVMDTKQETSKNFPMQIDFANEKKMKNK